MTNTTITTLPDPSGFSSHPLTEILRSGARNLIQQAVEAELTALLLAHAGETTEDGHARLVRHGHLPEREVMTGIGPVAVKVPGCVIAAQRLRRSGSPRRFCRPIHCPAIAACSDERVRKAKSIEELLPWLYLKGISTGDFQEALAALLGPNAAGLSSTTISRLKSD